MFQTINGNTNIKKYTKILTFIDKMFVSIFVLIAIDFFFEMCYTIYIVSQKNAD